MDELSKTDDLIICYKYLEDIWKTRDVNHIDVTITNIQVLNIVHKIRAKL